MAIGGETVLIVCDPNLKSGVERLVRWHLPAAMCVCWGKTDSSLKELVGARDWSVVMSVYSDYIFAEDELRRIRVPLNFHPALPVCPGVGYDVQPLIDRHGRYGATLHWMEPSIDSGRVIRTVEAPLPEGWSYADLRRANQAATLQLFEAYLTHCAHAVSLEAFETLLNTHAAQAEQWRGRYLSYRCLASKIRHFREREQRRFETLGIPERLYAQ